MIRQSFCAVVAALLLLLARSACSVDDMRKEFPSNFELMSDQVAEGTLDVPVSEIFLLGVVQVGKLADAAGRGDTKQMQQLVAQGASVNGVGQRAMTPLLWAMGKRNMTGFLWLLEHGADPNFVSCCDTKKPKLSPMALAAQGGDSRFLEALLNHGGNPNLVINDAGQTPIFNAVTLRRMRNIDLLIEAKADLNVLDIDEISLGKPIVIGLGYTPLQYAMHASQFEIALTLLHAGADPCVKDRSGHTAVGGIVGRANSGTTPKDREAFPQVVEYLKRFRCG